MSAVDKGRGRTCSIAYAALSRFRALKSSSVTRPRLTRDRFFEMGELSFETKLFGNRWVVESEWARNCKERISVADISYHKRPGVLQTRLGVQGFGQEKGQI
jgi:hypothetical protein